MISLRHGAPMNNFPPDHCTTVIKMDTITAYKKNYTFIFLMTVMFDDFQPSYFTTLQLLDNTLDKREY